MTAMTMVDTATGRRDGVGPILVVEDDPDLRALVRESLEGDGLAVATAADGAQALAWAAGGRRPALVVLDLLLPGMRGEEVARRLRDALGAAPPIVIMTGLPRAQEGAERAGGLMFLRKPFALDDLRTMVRAVLQAL